MNGGQEAGGPQRAGPQPLPGGLAARAGWRRACEAAIWAAFAAAVAQTFAFAVDDAFITMRYAANLVDGHGPTFNPGVRVEGFSSPLHLLVLAVLEVLPGGGSLLRAKLASVVFAGLALLASRRLLRSLPIRPWLSCLGLLLVAGSSIGAFAAVNGLETSLASLLVVLTLRSLVDGSAVSHAWRAGVPAGLLLWTRPEAPLLLAAVAVAGLVVAAGPERRAGARWVAVAAAFGGGVLALRLALYGQLLPNTYVAKHVPVGRAIRPGIGYVAVSVVPQATFVPRSPGQLALDVLLVAVMACFAVGAWWCWKERSPLLVLPAAVLGQVCFAVLSGSDWMRGGRFLAPVLVPAVATLVLGVDHLAGPVGQRERWPRWLRWRGPALAAVLVAAAVVPWRLLDHPSVGRVHGGLGDRSLLAAGAEDPAWLRYPSLFACAGPGGTVATTEIGFGPWVRRDVRIMDLSGLTDRRIASRAPAADHWVIGIFEPDWNDPTSFTVREVLARRPDVVVVSGAVDPRSAFGRAYRPAGGARYGDQAERAFTRRDHRCAGR